jgi:DNA-binding transcriptional ArsR family regulator
MEKAILDLIIHPVRLRIMQFLALGQLTTQQISEALPDVPASSIYRHMRLLLKSGLVCVAETRPVKGIEEKVYALSRAPRITDPAAFAGLTPQEHIHYFTMFAAALIGGFADYVHSAPERDMLADRVGYTEALFYGTPDEVDALGQAINEALARLAHNPPGEGRTLHKFSVVLYPVKPPSPADD